ncbi:MAG: sensor domain-containing diguanylate cyclase [Candidatus Omnitrophica bacterium]|nr:sensor domain-containing diguanylate cyclase [Candidatus Omnitrophota bacterium]
MRTFRNFIFLVICLFVMFLNYQLLSNVLYPPLFYLITFEVMLLSLMLADLLLFWGQHQEITALKREVDRQRLTISDYQVESKLLTTLRDMMEHFRSDYSLEETLEKIVDSVASHFHQETVILQLFGEKFYRVVRGNEVEVTQEVLEEVVIRGHPVLINNTGSFSEYQRFNQQKIQSMIIAPLVRSRDVIGLLGVFSGQPDRRFTSRDLDLLRMVIAPTCLIIENTELFEKTRILAITDSLTQVYNRGHFERVFSQLFSDFHRRNEPVSLAMCDIDHFKNYNDTNGHQAGDKVLREIATILKKGTKGSDIVARYGGEEFVIIFPQTTKANAIKICEDLRLKVQQYPFLNEDFQPEKDLTLSFGVASFPEDATSPQELLKKADEALYQAKNRGRNQVVAQ